VGYGENSGPDCRYHVEYLEEQIYDITYVQCRFDHHLLASTVHAATGAGPRVKGFDAALRQWGFKNRGENRALEVKRWSF